MDDKRSGEYVAQWRRVPPDWTPEEWAAKLAKYEREKRISGPLLSDDARFRLNQALKRRYQPGKRKERPATVQTATDAMRAATLAARPGWEYGPSGRTAGAPPEKRKRTISGGEMHGWDDMDDATLLAQATAQADAWDRALTAKQTAIAAARAALASHVTDCTDCPDATREMPSVDAIIAFGVLCGAGRTIQSHAIDRGESTHAERKRFAKRRHGGGTVELTRLDAMQARAWSTPRLAADPPDKIVYDGVEYKLGDDYSLPGWWYGGQASMVETLAVHMLIKGGKRQDYRPAPAPVTYLDADGKPLSMALIVERYGQETATATTAKRKRGRRKGQTGIKPAIGNRQPAAPQEYDGDTRGVTAFQRIEF